MAVWSAGPGESRLVFLFHLQLAPLFLLLPSLCQRRRLCLTISSRESCPFASAAQHHATTVCRIHLRHSSPPPNSPSFVPIPAKITVILPMHVLIGPLLSVEKNSLSVHPVSVAIWHASIYPPPPRCHGGPKPSPVHPLRLFPLQLKRHHLLLTLHSWLSTRISWRPPSLCLPPRSSISRTLN